mmetsp:Transcript_11973/g.19846  ORF Transcript_11973/g.19846 Transcript_11973/m.19846 type:complete len:328 (+) Transcript_11973:156-1139(+)|eukprot:CAMPEP_0119017690 /NCGR_PEP_ID=MMETSP1176-20130426/17368_1 /TAXON_ID=265551 /ORGANISM="Synedropsis recta cf, Strain CCMP1620" /LENGTH=327 /DNA_ID=CAMNT_0006971485 /DNA_START=93 /DNA_END=1076 /DNA_ORIENTATION=+
MSSAQNGVATEKDALLITSVGAAITTADPGCYSRHLKGELQNRERTGKHCLSIVLVLTTFLVILLVGSSFMPRWDQIRASSRRKAKIQKAAKALATLNQGASYQVPDGCESTLLIIRHCNDHGPDTDSEDGSQHCSRLGHERTQYLTTQFGNDYFSRWPLPSHLFGLWKNKNMRQFETLQPLSQKSNVKTRMYTFPGISNLVSDYFRLLQSNDGTTTVTMCGRVSVIAWKHAFIPELAVALGCGPAHGCPEDWPQEDFDQVWELQYVFQQRKEDENTPLSETTSFPHPSNNEDQSFPQNGWNVYFSETQENFDPLAYSKLAGITRDP